ncbi:MAG: cupin domain-containing protein [Pseudomonadota bacterium]
MACINSQEQQQHMYKSKIFLVISLLLWLSVVYADTLLDATTSWDGGEIYYPEGKAEVTSFILKLEEGKEVPYHCHPVPTMAYVLKGDIEVETANGDKTVLKEGHSTIEVMKTMHRGMAVGGPAEIIVFYAGAEGVPNTIMMDDERAEEYCH